ncbi:glycosyltransferase family 2 protein [Naumannella halotolerans]|uniref:Galactosyltransferase-like protein n=1 Tax=Naumannella halotolerans TaxID=993414 RepID=A0A4R7JAU4_9ACTN|nr:galactosyltransferase-related protein [Naumannella halotolerans]TDT33693.1 galactosyltransferase-like protein [Naumannella halotolerans]
MSTAVVTLAFGRTEHLAQQARMLAAGTQLPDDYVVVRMRAGDQVRVPAGDQVRVPAGDQVHTAADDLADVPVDDHAGIPVDDHAGTVDPALSTRWLDLPVDPARLPLAAARNLGVEAAIEAGAQTVILLDVDCVPAARLVESYRRLTAQQPEVIWSGPVTYLSPEQRVAELAAPAELAAWTDPHPARRSAVPGPDGLPRDLFWSLSFALTAATWRTVGGFCTDYTGYGGEDTDFARLAEASGIGLGWSVEPMAYHQYHPTRTPPVQHLQSIVANANLFRSRWSEFPMVGWLEEFARRGLIRLRGEHWELTDQIQEG